jgi:pre-rRNA-processing protein IPI1
MITSLPVDSPLPQPLSAFLPKLLPLILDQSQSVRTHLLLLLKALPAEEVGGHTERIILFIQSGMTHLAADVRVDSTGFLSWLVAAAGEDLVSTSIGWVKTLKCFLALLGWEGAMNGNGTTGKITLGKVNPSKVTIKHLQALSQFVAVGVNSGEELDYYPQSDDDRYRDLLRTNLLNPHWTTPQHLLPTSSNCYAYLNLFASGAANKTSNGMSEIAEDVESRRRMIQPFMSALRQGSENLKREAGEVGRAAAAFQKVLAGVAAAGEDHSDEDD